MKITKVTYQKAFVTGPFLQERIGYEAEVDSDNESPSGALTMLQRMADIWHKENNPHIYQEIGSTNIPEHTILGVNQFMQQSSPIINIQHEKIQIAIENAKTLEELKDIKTVNPLLPVPLMEMYNSKLKQLTNG